MNGQKNEDKERIQVPAGRPVPEPGDSRAARVRQRESGSAGDAHEQRETRPNEQPSW